MREELVKKLTKNFPSVYRTTSVDGETLPLLSFDCGDGWFDLLYELSEKLETLLLEFPEKERGCYKAIQIKEKFGGLRFYTGCATELMLDLIHVAEGMSFHICDVCGKPGKRYNGGWVVTRCDDHKPEDKG